MVNVYWNTKNKIDSKNPKKKFKKRKKVKRNKNIASGPRVRYFQHSAGVVNAKKPLAIRIFLPVIVTGILFGGGGYFGLNYFDSKNVVLQSNNTSTQEVEIKDTEDDSINLEPYRAVEDELLGSAIQSKIDSMPSSTEWSVSVRDLKSGRMANINADQKMEAASLYKLFLIAPLEKRLSSEYWTSYMGKQTINECVTLMISVSDNDCPNYLGYYMNWQTVDETSKELGFKNTSISSKDGNKTTSRDVSELMFRLQNSQILSDKARRLIFDALYDQSFRDGIPSGCGQECLVGNKTGELHDVKHDAAIVTHGESQYVVVIMSKGANWQQLADLESAIDEAMRP